MMLKQFIRGKLNQPIGVMVSEKIDGVIHYGWSLCCKKDRAGFNKDFGLNVAHGRMLVGSKVKIPHSIAKQVNDFKARSNRYFNKGLEVASEKEMSNAAS